MRSSGHRFAPRVAAALALGGRALAFSFSLGLVANAGCGAAALRVDPETRTVQAREINQSLSYQFGPVPGTWREIQIEDNDVAWHDPGSHAVVHVDHSCERTQDTPLPSLVQHLLIQFTDREIVSEETVPFDGREARHVVVRARLDGVAVMLELYVMKKDGCVYDLGVVATPDQFARISPDFAAFARGFHTVNTGTPSSASGAQDRR